ncbi:MAG: BMP family ABC transporter substrate-binding protein [Anaerolineales bacterium]|nr:BMP family ABC transporter substrate-binding protein [Anaerolineales bacterium]
MSLFLRRMLTSTLLVLAAACTATPTPNLTPAPPTPNIIVSTPTASGVIDATPTSEPSATPESTRTVGVVGTDEAWLNTVRRITGNLALPLNEGAEASALVAQGAQALILDEAASPQAAELARTNPNVFIIAQGTASGEVPANLLVLGGPASREDQAGFLAGVLAAHATELERVAVVSDPSTSAGKKYRNGFTAGVRYVCPKCQMDLVDLPATTDAPTVSATVLRFVALGADVFWVAPGGYAPAALEALATKNVSVIAEAGENFLANVALDYGSALATALQNWQAGQTPSGQQPFSVASGGITITVQNNQRGLLSPLDLTDVEAARQKLATGALETGVDPLTGEEK